ncbi:ribosome biogenesis GTP-binding protein YihA/YsxC [Rubricoccus marinus]|uniref:Probable GTP-binding protein EngB n=1 Tax=Rubricoccus marinus TaxID=716817 RepID=A0A259TWE3_9BACT|nr:ribosome biogenesis GTP-binding protein YihA/YsxC [Rubricoccus marinus]OZC02102.1 ribosome biogenesis GTP-binding protein YsxC [Rubricoccus marinus]
MNIKSAQFVTAAPGWAQMPEDGTPEVAFLGRSNVGKSSLLNAMLGRKALAHTSGTPGKTQALNYYRINGRHEQQDGALGQGGFFLVDLPGYGYAKVSQKVRAKWQQLIGQYAIGRAETGQLRAIVHLVDGRHPPTKLDTELALLLRESAAPHIVALTKGDKLSGNTRPKAEATARKHFKALGLELPVVTTSAQTKRGIEDLWKWVEPNL